MVNKVTAHDPGLAKVIEKQMRNWEIARTQHLDSEAALRSEVQQFVAMSNDVGAGGGEIASQLSKKLNWPIFHREILTTMANDDKVREQLYRSMDERDLGWFEEAFRSLTQDEFKKNDYFHRLTETVLVLARQSHAIFLGRAADLILPRKRGLRVKIVGSLEYRIQRFAEHNQVNIDEARKTVARIERERGDFISHRFPQRTDDRDRFDLMINAERLTTEQATKLVLGAMCLREIIE